MIKGYYGGLEVVNRDKLSVLIGNMLVLIDGMMIRIIEVKQISH